jgi:SAM-dependent methyltransferase
VLDVGCGLGGPSRFLASAHACRVSGIDLTPQFVEIATQLARLTRLETKVDYQQGDALAIPFDAPSFDVVWSQNVAMNISDRKLLYSEIHRVLRPRGKYAFSDVVSGEGGEPHFPLPWASNASESHLRSAQATRDALLAAGFAVVAWEDATEQSMRAALERAGQASLPPLGLHVLFGADWPAISANMLRSYKERRIGVLLGVVERSS